MTEADNPETIQSVCKKFEAMLKQQSVIDSGSECPIITYEVAKKLGFEKDKSLSNITDKRYLALLSKWQVKNLDFSSSITGDSEARDSARYYKRDSKPQYFSKKSYTMQG
ncbi:7364_t:CDS:1 [Entrophospora sp. SA101]|nr:4099_t:CDS:1 [Entrophospora sp. SA101]CAJ0835440.1 7364_t:CDS:1 [Entrophospora sp. SA101]